jgi:hypothetical protein
VGLQLNSITPVSFSLSPPLLLNQSCTLRHLWYSLTFSVIVAITFSVTVSVLSPLLSL